MDFDAAIATLTSWVGEHVNVQVSGSSELVLHADGELQAPEPRDAEGLVVFELGPGGDVGLWLWREHVDRVFWVDNAQMKLGIQTQGLTLTLALEAA